MIWREVKEEADTFISRSAPSRLLPLEGFGSWCDEEAQSLRESRAVPPGLSDLEPGDG